MKSFFNILFAIVVGAVLGALVNGAIVQVGPSVIPLPEGADMSTPETMVESIELFEPIHFITPWLAHALGTLVGAFIAAKLAKTHRMKCALAVGFFFLLGGIAMVVVVGGPTWFKIADLALAYIPMAYIGGALAGARRPQEA